MHGKFIPASKDESTFNLLLNLDDDKVHHNYFSKRKVRMGQESKLKCIYHVRDSRNGFTDNVISHTAPDFPVASQSENEDESLFECVMDLIRVVFNI